MSRTGWNTDQFALGQALAAAPTRRFEEILTPRTEKGSLYLKATFQDRGAETMYETGLRAIWVRTLLRPLGRLTRPESRRQRAPRRLLDQCEGEPAS